MSTYHKERGNTMSNAATHHGGEAMTTLQEVLAAHQWSFIKHGCRCDEPATYGEWAAHVTEAVRAAGLAVVELPKPEADDDGQLWFGDLRVDTTGPGLPTIQRMFSEVSPALARAIGADYLAAANAAEGSS